MRTQLWRMAWESLFLLLLILITLILWKAIIIKESFQNRQVQLQQETVDALNTLNTSFEKGINIIVK